MRFADISGHHDTIRALRQMADSDRIPHAIMLCGASGIGKTRLARAFAQYVHCSHRHNGDSCGRCPSCIQHQALNNPDMHYVYPVIKQSSPKRSVSTDYIGQWRQMLDTDSYMSQSSWLEILDAGNTQPSIYVDEADEIAAAASLSAFRENYKIFLIWQPERMRQEAANKLLKLIEEPFADTLFILVTNDSGSVLPTIFSRTQRFNMPLLSVEEVGRALVATGMEQAEAADVANLAEGSVGNALMLAADAGERTEFSNLFISIMRCAYARKIAMLKALSEKAAGLGRESLRRFLAYCAHMVRENFICNFGYPELNLMTRRESDFSVKFAPFIHEGNVEQMLAQMSRAANDVERNANAKIVMFDLCMYLCALIRATKRPAPV